MSRQERREAEELAALVGEAWAYRRTGYMFDAVAGILDWQDARHVRRHRIREERVGELLALLRETDPRGLGVAA